MTIIRRTGFGNQIAGSFALAIGLCLGLASHSFSQTSKGYKVISYNATVRLDRLADSLFGEVTMIGRADTAITGILQHVKYILVDSVDVNNQRAQTSAPDSVSGAYLIMPPKGISAGEIFTVHTYYHGPGKPEQYGSMAWGGVTDEDTMMFAMGVGFAAPYVGCTRHWLPCYDLPDDKPDSVDLTFLCRSGDVTASSGLLVSNTVSNGWRTMHWHVSHPIATYLLTFATGPFTEQNITNSLGKPFQVFALKRDSAAAATQMNFRVRQALGFFDSLFAPYPFEKVGYVVTPIGSMEHQTMISLAKQILDTNRLDAVHELSHQWWGDWVTCKTFDDAWLNEGFARYCESLFDERFFGKKKYFSDQTSNVKAEYSNTTKRIYIDTLPLYGAPTADHHTNNYPGTIYSKGGAVIGMLRDLLGDSIFFASIRLYGNAHAYSTAETADLQSAFEHTSGMELGWFFSEFVYDRGLPNVKVQWSRIGNGASIEFTQWQDTLGFRYFGMPVLVKGVKGTQSKSIYVWMDSTKVSKAAADFGFIPDTVTVNPLGDLLIRVSKSAEATVAQSNANHETYFNVFPNPSHHQPIEFEFSHATPIGRCQATIYDLAGRIVRHASYDSVDTYLRGKIDLTGLPSAQYMIRFESADGLLASYSFTLEP